MFFNIDGDRIDRDAWSLLFSVDAYRRVGLDEGDGWQVSTVWQGIDHNFRGSPPLIFASMVFGGPLDAREVWYSTLPEATAGHAELVKQTRAGVVGS